VRVSSWLRAEPLINRRAHLLGLLDKRIEVSINGEYQNRPFVDMVSRSIRLELRRTIEDIEARLRDLGVTID
jgi:hypothetical protein